jgi:hypothetical protein
MRTAPEFQNIRRLTEAAPAIQFFALRRRPENDGIDFLTATP